MDPQRCLIASVAVCASLLAGCATAPQVGAGDPLEPVNRKVDTFNRDLDHATLRPLATAYERAVPSVIRTGVSNVLGNVGDVWSAANSLLQLKLVDAVQDTMRVAVNTVFGLGGMFDIATAAGIDRHKQDFGATLGRWGMASGPYVVLPLFGPRTLRDAMALPVDWWGDPFRQLSPIMSRNLALGSSAVNARGQMLPLDPVLDGALDPYTFMRDAYLQHRNAEVYGETDGGEVPPADGELALVPAQE